MDYRALIAILVVIGVALIAVDFYLPGFVLGTVGVVLMLIALWICYQNTNNLTWTVALFIGEFALSIAGGMAAIKLGPKTTMGKKMILSHDQTGMRAQTTRPAELVGQTGVAQTVLRPAGVVIIDGKRHDVVAESGMIERGVQVKVVAVQENRIVVQKL